MRESANDPRVVRTRSLLRQALVQLAAERNFNTLSIQEVTDRAGLNRTTFYLHYTGLHELLEDCTRALFDEMRAKIYAQKPISGDWESTRLEPYVESVFQHLAANENFYRAMLGNQGDPFFRTLFQELLSELIFEPITADSLLGHTGPQFEITLQFFSAGFAGIAAWWLDKGMPISASAASLQVTRDILPGYLHILGINK